MIQALENFSLSDLGVVIRTKASYPRTEEFVIPTFFYHSLQPQQVKGYRFVFLINREAKLGYTLLNHRDQTVKTESLGFKRASKPFQVRLNASDLRKGQYDFVVEGHFIDDRAPLNQTVHFYHKSSIVD